MLQSLKIMIWYKKIIMWFKRYHLV